MIARVRGEHDSSGRWRRPPREPVREPPPPFELVSLELAGSEPEAGFDPTALWDEPVPSAKPARRGLRWARQFARALVVLVGISMGYVAVDWVVDQFAPASAPTRPSMVLLPATPRAWLDAYEAAAIDNPGKVCSQLLSPALARAYGRTAHGSCRAYFRRIHSSSVTLRRLLSEGSTAVLELRQTLNHADWAVVLSRQRSGWQAIDLLSGDLLR